MLPKVLHKHKPDIVILDPPRKGCESYIFDALEQQEIQKIIYVSCNPSTLARDAKILYEKGYKLSGLQPVDMFPHTHHVENVALLEKI